jgi:phosphoesterase RecJ-like protein
MEEFGVTAKDLDGIVSQLRITKGVEVAVFMYELEEGTFKVSLRSKRYANVSSVAQYFGGGGHIRAAGCALKGTPEEIIEKIAEQLKLQINVNEA